MATVVKENLFAVSPTLKRLILDVPLGALSEAEPDLAILDNLRPGFEALVNLEEFVASRYRISFTAPHGTNLKFGSQTGQTCVACASTALSPCYDLLENSPPSCFYAS
ncbi:hypothetical protein BGZ63DRAFT_78465 [Mariannaea sp. PMI_226]|nr:hypothetical protein BGZ63DRAFT_78465 [Mariannaea sp. PMI_226]